MNSFSASSCRSLECFKDLDIYGSINNTIPELICSFRGNYDSFRSKTANIDCQSNKLYNNITVVSPSINDNQQNKFVLYLFDIFGSVYKSSTKYSCKYQPFIPILTYPLYFFLLS